MSVLGRAFSVLDAFADGTPSLRLTAIAERSALPLPTALRLVRELVAWGGLERQSDGSYRLGSRLWTLGGQAPCRRRLVETGRPVLDRLNRTTGLPVLLAALDGIRFVVVDGVGSTLRPGTMLPPHATAAGKVLLAYLPDSRRRQVLADLVRLTPYTLTAPGPLDRQLATIRAGAPASAWEEWRLGENEVAVPVDPFAAQGPAAALTVTARSAAQARRAVPLVARAALTISGSLRPAGQATACAARADAAGEPR
ncbi:Transcriptional regulator [Frankia canadensis]|uniref:Transcriptional regulator n=1 Tax=Frankia canadensis TaxID=1836972 RepID=A0A2I2L0B4_9ACTN|nr:IclR family transcriptional regulator [Frankia canadensis]SNQ51349.1 Transcriptional regulator [Frankia canadensis]SOU58639.1 Transcriptional regulator [Frankia canadensis]